PDSELSSDPPQKRYMGVRVKMPVRELLRKIRLSKGLDAAHGKGEQDTSCLLPSPTFRPPRLLLPFQSKQSAGQSPKGLEDLDILVEVLQEDLNKSQLREEPLHPVPDGAWQGFSADPQSSRWESAASKEAAGLHQIPQGRQRSSAELHQEPWVEDLHPILRAEAEISFPGEQGSAHGSGPPGMFCRTGERGSSCGMRDALPSSQEGFPRDSPSQDTPALLSPAEMLLEAPGGSPDSEGHPRLAPMSFTQQDLSALSFFQFQLRREESLLRSIPAEKLLAPDENGNRLLHKAVAQGRRALTFALAQRFASLNKINEKDAEERTALHLAAEKNQHLMVSDLISLGASVNEQDSSGKTPLHLCAESGYLRVLQVLKNCKDSGVCVEVDVPDHYGLTPLHCAALAHTVLVTESHGTARDSERGRLLSLRREQILEGILCLLQM
ncbi:IKBZ inhibitor, partial [Chaetorhynchus papuensis]|nr:IKBZ inhibitor [Chaetorhynchus papuensis]